MALHIFNFSIDTRDTNPDSIPEDLSVNDIESITEFMTEVVWGIDNAIEEHDEPDSDNGGSLDFIKLFYTKNHNGFSPLKFNSIIVKKYFILNSPNILGRASEINSPPPKS